MPYKSNYSRRIEYVNTLSGKYLRFAMFNHYRVCGKWRRFDLDFHIGIGVIVAYAHSDGSFTPNSTRDENTSSESESDSEILFHFTILCGWWAIVYYIYRLVNPTSFSNSQKKISVLSPCYQTTYVARGRPVGPKCLRTKDLCRVS